MIKEYLMILKDIGRGMIKPKQAIESIKNRGLDLRSMFLVVVILMVLTLISMLHIRSTAIAFSQGVLPDFITNDQEKFELILASDTMQMIVQIIYSLVVGLMASSIYVKCIVWLSKVKLSLRECFSLVCYAWGPNLLSTALLMILILIFPAERTMFAQGLFEVTLGKSSVLLAYLSIVDPFYVWTVIILGRYAATFESSKGSTKWHIWIYIIFLFPVLMNLIMLVQQV